MRQRSLKIAVFCLVRGGQIALAAEGDTPPVAAVVKIVRVETAPVIDGVLSEGDLSDLSWDGVLESKGTAARRLRGRGENSVATATRFTMALTRSIFKDEGGFSGKATRRSPSFSTISDFSPKWRKLS